MTIACQSSLSATDNVQVPGPIEFRLTLKAGFTSAKARITFMIRDHAHCIRFANGTWLEQVQAPVSTTGTDVVHRAQLIGIAGNTVSTLGIEARVEEDGAFQCREQTTVSVVKCTCLPGAAPADLSLEEVVATVIEPRPSRPRQAKKATGTATKKAAASATKKPRGSTRDGAR